MSSGFGVPVRVVRPASAIATMVSNSFLHPQRRPDLHEAGISDAFRDAELCATALDEALSGARPFEDAMADYQSERDRLSLPFYELTAQLAPLEPLPDELGQLLAATQGNQEAMDQFARVAGAVMSPADFFSDENVGRILAGVR